MELTEELEVAEDGSLTVQTEMQPLQAVTISTHGQGEVAAGSMRVVAEGPLGGVLRFDLPGVGVAGVGASQPVTDALIPARRAGGSERISTAAAIRNLEAEELLATCRLMQDGMVLEEVDIELEVNGQNGRFIEEVFTATDTSDFGGVGALYGGGRVYRSGGGAGCLQLHLPHPAGSERSETMNFPLWSLAFRWQRQTQERRPSNPAGLFRKLGVDLAKGRTRCCRYAPPLHTYRHRFGFVGGGMLFRLGGRGGRPERGRGIVDTGGCHLGGEVRFWGSGTAPTL